jgi:hypothetical protein
MEHTLDVYSIFNPEILSPKDPAQDARATDFSPTQPAKRVTDD